MVPASPPTEPHLQRANGTVQEEVPHVLLLHASPRSLDERNAPASPHRAVSTKDAVACEQSLHAPAAEHRILVRDEPSRRSVSPHRLPQQSDRERTVPPAPDCADREHTPREGVDDGPDPEQAHEAADPRGVDHPDVVGTLGKQDSASRVRALRFGGAPGTAPEDPLHTALRRLHPQASEVTGDPACAPAWPGACGDVRSPTGSARGRRAIPCRIRRLPRRRRARFPPRSGLRRRPGVCGVRGSPCASRSPRP